MLWMELLNLFKVLKSVDAGSSFQTLTIRQMFARKSAIAVAPCRRVPPVVSQSSQSQHRQWSSVVHGCRLSATANAFSRQITFAAALC